MNTVQIGQRFEDRAKELMLKKGYKIVEHTAKNNWYSPYDFIIKKGNIKYYLEVRGRSKNQNYFTIKLNKLRNLSKISNNVLILLINEINSTLINIIEIKNKKNYCKNDMSLYISESKIERSLKNAKSCEVIKYGKTKLIYLFNQEVINKLNIEEGDFIDIKDMIIIKKRGKSEKTATKKK